MIRKYFIAGLLVWLPIWVTFFIIKFLFDLLDRTIALLPTKYQPAHLLGMDIPGLGVLFALLILFITGVLARNFIGHRIVAAWDTLLSRIPLIRSIHSAVKQVSHAILQPAGTSFRNVLLIEFPKEGVWSIGFQTSEQFDSRAIDLEEETLTVFVPTTPNPTSGFLMVVPKKDTKNLNITIEEALRMIISLGVVIPDKIHKEKVFNNGRTN